MNIFGRSPHEIAKANMRRERERLRREAETQAKTASAERRRSEMINAAHAELTRASEIYERYTKENVHYANVILLLGYGGFFVLWSSLANRMPRGLFGIAGGLVATSLIIFLSFEIAKIGACSWALRTADKNGLNEHLALGHINKTLNKVNSWWLWAFIPCVIAGLVAGAIVLWAYWSIASQGPWVP